MVDDRNLDATLGFGDFLIDRRDERLIGPAGPIHIGRKAYRMLTLLAELDGKLLTKDDLLSSVWDGTVVSEAALTSVVKELRRALGDDSRVPRYIETVYGRGFRLLAPVTREAGGRAPSARPAPAERPLKQGSPPILVVSAFSGHGGAGGPDLAAQLREEVVSGLARFRELQLIADVADEGEGARRFGGRAYRLTAMLIPQPDGVKVIARLERLGDGVVVWTESVAVAAFAMAAGVETIVRRIVGAALPVVDDDMFLELPSETESVYQAYLSAKWCSHHCRTYAEAREAARALEDIVARHPGFALAYPPLVRLYNIDFGYTGLGSTGPRERMRALALAKDGLAADRGNAHAHSVLGFCHLWHGDLPLARACFDRSLALNPYSHVRVQEAATAFMYMGEGATARELLERAAELNPFPDDNYHEDMGRLLLIEGEFEAARRNLRSLLNSSVWAELYLAVCELRLGMGEGRNRMAAWTDAVARRWHTAERPNGERLTAWVRLHHPFAASVGEAFTDGLAAELAAAATSAASASK